MEPARGEVEYANIRAYINRVAPSKSGEEAKPCWYASCTKCSKKCIGEDGAGFSCEACGWTGDKCTYRYILQMAIQDATSTGYVTAFNEQAASILGKSADELKALKDVSQDEYDAVLALAAWRPFNMRVRGKMDTYNDVSRLKLQIWKMEPVNFATEARLLLKDCFKYPNVTERETSDAAMPDAVVKEE